MKKNESLTWTQALGRTPGPESPRAALILYAKGLCMGCADVVPGVSGGTIALITGIYEKLLAAIKSFDAGFIKKMFRLDIKAALATAHVRFLVILLAGIATAIISLARIMHHLLLTHPVLTWSLFFGLILASIHVVSRKVPSWRRPGTVFSFVAGTAAAWIVVGLIPVSTPETWWFIFISGFIAICAMILPGLSGAFLLLILGKYEFITGAIKNPLLPDNMIIMIIFCAGAAAGVISFSRLLKWALDRWHDLAMAFLTGLMTGSLRKIWPWKETLETTVVRGKVHVLREANILPPDFGADFWMAVLLALTGFAAVIALERLSSRKPRRRR
ncbi:MAG: DUF368 domain-containing protein [Desulfosudaceae bacterium]